MRTHTLITDNQLCVWDFLPYVFPLSMKACAQWEPVSLYNKGPFGAHDMIEIGYDMKLDKDRKWYKHDNIYPITCLVHTW